MWFHLARKYSEETAELYWRGFGDLAREEERNGTATIILNPSIGEQGSRVVSFNAREGLPDYSVSASYFVPLRILKLTFFYSDTTAISEEARDETKLERITEDFENRMRLIADA